MTCGYFRERYLSKKIIHNPLKQSPPRSFLCSFHKTYNTFILVFFDNRVICVKYIVVLRPEYAISVSTITFLTSAMFPVRKKTWNRVAVLQMLKETFEMINRGHHWPSIFENSSFPLSPRSAIFPYCPSLIHFSNLWSSFLTGTLHGSLEPG